jgi:MSHA biogenesis protein MshN
MSLINQMLQDLEKRQPGAMPSTAPPTLVAVPTIRRIHPAWWAVTLLVILAGAFVWLVGFRPASKPVVVTTPPIAKKDATQIQPFQSPPQTPIDNLPPHTLAAHVTVAPPPVKHVAVVIPPPTPAVLPERTQATAQPEKTSAIALAELHEPEVVPADLALPRASIDKAKTKPQISADKPRPQISVASAEREAASVVAVTKQVKEFTPQQQAENAYRKAVALEQQGREKEAIEELTHALQLDPRHTAARQTLVGLLLEANRYGEAERKLQEGLAVAPDQPELVMILARLQVERGDIRGGLATLERALPYASENAPYHAFLAALLQRDARHREAIEHYLLALRNAPQTGVWLMGLGISLQAENRLSEAREAFSRARTSNTLSPVLQAFVEQRLKQLGQ